MPRGLYVAEIALWAAGLSCAVILVTDRVEVTAAQRAAAAIGGAQAVKPTPATESTEDPTSGIEVPSAPATVTNGMMGRLEIPALHLVTPIIDNTDFDSLKRGAGHIPGTALPGGLGNFVVAAHRDTFFRPLSAIRAGMKIRVVTPAGSYIYSVDSTKIVWPADVDVLDMGDVPQMTLITCYPFHYIGAAPQRFTVRAHLISY